MVMLGNLHKLSDRIPEEDQKQERRLMDYDPADNIALVSLRRPRPNPPCLTYDNKCRGTPAMWEGNAGSYVWNKEAQKFYKDAPTEPDWSEMNRFLKARNLELP